MFTDPKQPNDSGFIDIGQAEVARQGSVVATFRTGHSAEYDRLVAAVVRVKLAHQELEASKAACKSVPAGTSLGDLLDSAERAARGQLQQAAEESTLAQLEQLDPVATTATRAKSPKAS